MPMIIVSGIILYQFKTSYSEKIYVHLETLVKKHKLNIDSFLNEKLGDIRFIASSSSLKDLSDPKILQAKLSALQNAFGPVFVDLGVINSEGAQVVYSGPYMLENALYSDAKWFEKAAAQGMAGRSLLSVTDGSARTAGLGDALKRVEPDGSTGVRVWLEGAPFDSVIGWLRVMSSSYGVDVDSASIERTATAGRVNARLSLQAPQP